MRVIHVLRKPLSEGSVAANTLSHGAGGLNINTSRVGTHKRVPTSLRRTRTNDGFSVRGFSDGSLRNETGDEDGWNPNLGRFPANMILQHLEGCRCDGTKRVYCPPGGVSTTMLGFMNDDGWKPRPRKHVRGWRESDGKETVDNWICEPDCPVAQLDEQSGVSFSTGGGMNRSGLGNLVYGQQSGHPKVADVGHGGVGGASRYFKQVGGKRDE